MYFRIIIIFPLVGLLTVASTVTGQILGDANYFYARTAIAATGYFGDLTDVNTDKPLFSFGYKFGGGYFMKPDVAIGLDYRVGNHPRTDRPNARGYTQNHTVNVFATYIFRPENQASPYLLGGMGMTFFGTYDKDPNFAPVFGPMIGAGVNLRLSDHISLFFEGKTDIIFDDEALDEVKGERGLDVLVFLGGGIRVAMRSAFRPVGSIEISGPLVVTGLESVLFEAVVGGNPTEPMNFQWDLGDGTRAVGPSVSHVYTTPGTYTVRLRVSNRRSVRTVSKNIVVREMGDLRSQ
jgi:hypothetical protein